MAMWFEHLRYIVPLRLRSLLRRGQVERELDDELRYHVEQLTDEYVGRGMTAGDARAKALRALGGVDQRKEECRDVRRVLVIESLARDLRQGMRSLRRNPGFTAAAVLSLALGIGANTAIFSLVDSLLLRTLPVVAPERLAILSGPASPNSQMWTYAIWDQIRQQRHQFGRVAAWGAPGPGAFRFNLARGGEMQPIDGIFASGDYFETLGVPPLLGRTFTTRDDVRGGGPDGPVAVISHAFWQRHFGGAKRVVGTTLPLNGVTFTIVGVTPPDFFGAEVGRSADVTVPIGVEPLLRGRDSYVDHRSAFWLTIMVRLAPDQTLESATSALRVAQPRIREGAMPSQGPPQALAGFLRDPLALTPATTGVSSLRQRYERPLLVLFVVVALVLLITCANVANLLLARATARTHEFTVRRALGAARWRLAQQLLVESLLLSVAGAALGLLCAMWAGRALAAQLSRDDSRVVLDLSLDWRLLAFVTVVALTTTVLFGMAPALHGIRAKPSAALREEGRGSSREGRSGVSSTLVIGQVALSLVLVVAAGLFVRTFTRLASVPLGFEADRVLLVRVNESSSQLDTPQRLVLYHRLVSAAAAVPGVARTAGSTTTPLVGIGTWGGTRVEVPGGPSLTERESRALVNFVTPGWFATYGTPLREGRDVGEGDTPTTTRVAVVNEAFARRFFPGRSAVGSSLSQFPGPRTSAIVGVVADALYVSVREPHVPTIYLPMRQYDWWTTPLPNISISVRAAAGPPSLLTHSVASALMAVDRGLQFAFRPLEDQVNAALTQERLLAALSGTFGGLALLLATLGLYGTTSYAVNRSRRELSIRMALGAAPGGIVRLVLTHVLLLVAVGLGLGVIASLWASRFAGTLLYGLEPRDPATLAGAAIILAAVGALSGGLPAWRASRVDPARVLRET